MAQIRFELMRSTRAVVVILTAMAVGLVFAGCVTQQPSPGGSATDASTPVDCSAVLDPGPNNPDCPYTWWCGQGDWALPAITPLTLTPSPAPHRPISSNYPALQLNREGVIATNFFMVGDCDSGAIVTVDPVEAAVTLLLWYGANGGVAFITLGVLPGQSYLLRAWTTDGSYLGEYEGEG